jgi:hypothetical protein
MDVIRDMSSYGLKKIGQDFHSYAMEVWKLEEGEEILCDGIKCEILVEGLEMTSLNSSRMWIRNEGVSPIFGDNPKVFLQDNERTPKLKRLYKKKERNINRSRHDLKELVNVILVVGETIPSVGSVSQVLTKNHSSSLHTTRISFKKHTILCGLHLIDAIWLERVVYQFVPIN